MGPRIIAIIVWTALASETVAQERTKLEYDTAVVSLAVSPDGGTLAVATESGLRLLDTGKATEIQSIPYPGIRALRFLPGSNSLLILTSGALKKRDLATKKETQVATGSLASVLALSPDGKTAAIVDGRCVLLVDVDTGVEKRRIEGRTERWQCAAFSPDGMRIAAGASLGEIRVWETETGKTLMEGKGSNVLAVAFLPDGKSFFSSQRGLIARWDVASGRWEAVGDQGLGSEIQHLLLSPDGKRMAIACRQKIYFVHPASGIAELSMLGHSDDVGSLAFSPDGAILYSGSGDKTVRIWDAREAKPVGILAGHSDAVNAVGISPDGKLAASAGADGSLRLWDLRAMKEAANLKGHEGAVLSLAFSPDGRFLVSGGDDKLPRVWETAGARFLRVLARDLACHKEQVTSVVFSPDGKLVATAGTDSSIMLWDPSTGERRARWKVERVEFVALAFSPDGKWLASADVEPFVSGDERTRAVRVKGRWSIRLWNVEEGKAGETLGFGGMSISGIALSPEGTQMAVVGSGYDVEIWDWKKRERLRSIRAERAGFHSVAWSSDGKRIATAGKSGLVEVWDPSGPRRAALKGHQGEVLSVAFSADAKRLVSGGQDKTVLVWDVAP